MRNLLRTLGRLLTRKSERSFDEITDKEWSKMFRREGEERGLLHLLKKDQPEDTAEGELKITTLFRPLEQNLSAKKPRAKEQDDE